MGVIGGGDSAVEAAMGLASQVGNKVTLSYRQDRFTRIKDRNSRRIEECISKGKLTVLYRSMLVEVKEGSVIIEVAGSVQEIPNDYVWVFAGGKPPNEFLKKIGIGFGMQDLTLEASRGAKQEAAEKREMAAAWRARTRADIIT